MRAYGNLSKKRILKCYHRQSIHTSYYYLCIKLIYPAVFVECCARDGFAAFCFVDSLLVYISRGVVHGGGAFFRVLRRSGVAVDVFSSRSEEFGEHFFQTARAFGVCFAV